MSMIIVKTILKNMIEMIIMRIIIILIDIIGEEEEDLEIDQDF